MQSVSRHRNHSKRPAAKASRRRASTARPAKAAKLDYKPALASWEIDYWWDNPFDAVITEVKTKFAPEGLPVCRIVVDRRFTPESARRIVRFMSFAPALWQALRGTAIGVLEDKEGAEAYGQLMQLLWLSADQRPYEWPILHPDDKFIRLWNIAGIGQRTAREKEKLLKLIEASPLSNIRGVSE